MKKIIYTLMAFLLMTSSVFAAKAPSSSEVARLKKIFNITDVQNFKVEKIQNSTENGEVQGGYFYTWKSGDLNYSVSTDTLGNIYRFDNSAKSQNKTKFSPIGKTELAKIAEEFLNRVDSKLNSEYKIESYNIYTKEGNASLNYNRYINGIKVMNDTITLDIHFATKSVFAFNRSQEGLNLKSSDFPKANDILSKDEAFNKLSQNPLRLTQKIVDGTNILAYKNLLNVMMFDAKTGEIIETPVLYKEMKASDSMSSSLSEVELQEIENLKNLKTETDALNFIKNNFDLSGLKLSTKALTSDEDKNYFYSFYYISENEEVNKSKNFVVNAKDLSLKTFGEYEDRKEDENTKNPLTKEDAKKIAEEFLNKFGTKTEIGEPSIETYKDITTVYFPRVLNSVVIDNEGVKIDISNSYKKVVSYNSEFSNKQINTVSANVSLEEANKIAKESLNLNYYIDKTPKLVYNYENPTIRATDGKLLDVYGKEINKDGFSYEDLNTSKYQKEIEELSNLNIGMNVSKLKDKITNKDFADLASSISDRQYIYLSDEVFEDYTDELLDKNLKYKDAIKWLLNMDGIKNLQTTREVWDKTLYKDYDKIEKNYLGYYYMAKAHGIFTEDVSHQNEDITAEQMLHLVYQYINKEKTETV